MLVTVLWRDASINTEEEGTPETIKGQDDATQLLETCGWWLGVKEDQVLLGQDLSPKHPDQLIRTIVRIPRPLVISVWAWSRGRQVSLTAKAVSGPGTRKGAAGKPGSKWGSSKKHPSSNSSSSSAAP